MVLKKSPLQRKNVFYKLSVVKYERVFQFVIKITYVINSAVIKSSKQILFC